MWNYLFIPILIYLSKEFSLPKAHSTFLLPSQRSDDSSTDSLTSVPRCPAVDPNLNYRPVVGILSHPGDGASGRLNNAATASFIPASYVKFVESAGARVIPLIYNEPPETLLEKLQLVNGVLFTGGWVASGLYFETLQRVFKKVLEKNDAGEHFPLYAICLGFQLVSMIVSKDRNILERFSAADQASTLQFMKNINIEGTVFERFPPDLLKKLGTDCLVRQNHVAVTITQAISFCFFKILTTSADENDKVYVSTVQAHSYPVTAFQWHPEQNAFGSGSSVIPHSEDAIQVTQNVANFFISEARKSLNRPPTTKVLDNLIYNYSPTHSGKGYAEVYIFT
ncbi:hypothetical protein SLEP1_g45166 [Rubroshorea leprosula]|uniref:folate gamma-glutamyl hydrolase n=1 Tax=Rubroshorea leprosula TaxID=152421 RepID=A0AAV5LIA1_9ROSI|nr:hypothetical protein SLEP1_g45166 [Rubroshorea leprosula]